MERLPSWKLLPRNFAVRRKTSSARSMKPKPLLPKGRTLDCVLLRLRLSNPSVSEVNAISLPDGKSL